MNESASSVSAEGVFEPFEIACVSWQDSGHGFPP